jgi:ADP-heptose:LPS heptosyltransferase
MTTPLLEVIRHAYPQANITYVAGTYSKVVPEHHPSVNTVIDSGTVGIPGRYSFYDYMKLVILLRKHHFDLAFVLDRSPMLTLLPWLAGIPCRIGPDSLGRGFSLTDRVPISTSPTQLQHQATIYLDLARVIGLPINHPRMRFEPTAEERSDAVGPRFIAPVGQGEANTTQSDAVGADLSCPPPIYRPTEQDDPVGPRFIVPTEEGEANTSQDKPSDFVGARFIAPTGSGGAQFANNPHTRVAVFPGGGSNPGMNLAAKRWPLERYQELVRRLVRELDVEVLLIGGPEDIDLNRRLLEGLDVPTGTITNLAGKTTIGQLAAQLEQCAFFIGNDSSPMHLAAAVGTPVIAIFGPTSPQEYGPYPLDDPKHIAIWHHPIGQPCFFLGKMQTCTACTCMQSVTVDEVWDTVRLLWSAQLPKTK